MFTHAIKTPLYWTKTVKVHEFDIASLPISSIGIPIAWTLFLAVVFLDIPRNCYGEITWNWQWCNQWWHSHSKCKEHCFQPLMIKLIFRQKKGKGLFTKYQAGHKKLASKVKVCICVQCNDMSANNLYDFCVCLSGHVCVCALMDPFPKASCVCWIKKHMQANTLQVVVWDRPGRLVTVCSPSLASFICCGRGQNAISCEGEARGTELLGGQGMQRTSKAPESYQELEYCQRCVPTRQFSLSLWCTRTSAVTIPPIHCVC